MASRARTKTANPKPRITGYKFRSRLDNDDTMTGYVWKCKQCLTIGDEDIFVTRALKILKPEVAASHRFGAHFMTDFTNEIHSLLDLSHPNIVAVVTGGETSLDGAKVPYYVMEYVKAAKNIVDFVKEKQSEGSLDAKQLLELVRQFLEGVAAIHSTKLVHMDLKPANVLVGQNGVLKIADLGFARSFSSGTRKKLRGYVVQVKGTEGYFDPDLKKELQGPPRSHKGLPEGMVAGVVDPKHLSPSSDLYTAGVTIAEVADKLLQNSQTPRALAEPCNSLKNFGKDLRERKFAEAGEALQWFCRSFLEQVPLQEARHFPASFVRVPELANVPLSRRVIDILNDPLFQRLRHVRQLGFVHLVYPGATHTRFEHCVGAYHHAVKYLLALWENSGKFRREVEPYELEATILAALTHDIGQYPFAHVLEEAQVFPKIPKHARLSQMVLENSQDTAFLQAIGGNSLYGLLERDWDKRSISLSARLVNPESEKFYGIQRVLAKIISGAIDCDKLDYLTRDALHASCPYPRGIDEGRLFTDLRVLDAPSGLTLGITHKARSTVELLTFARYLMFTEVYWHHTVRIAMRMFREALNEMVTDRGKDFWKEAYRRFWSCGDDDVLQWLMRKAPARRPSGKILELVYTRTLYKRLLTVSGFGVTKGLYGKLKEYGDPAGQQKLERRFRRQLRRRSRIDFEDHQVLLDVPAPRPGDELKGLYMQQKDGSVVNLIEKDAHSLLSEFGESFLNNAKKFRILAHPDVADSLTAKLNAEQLIEIVGSAAGA